MATKPLATYAFAAGVLSMAASISAHAACGDRPGTPDNVSVQALSTTSIRFNWRITTRKDEVERYYDLQVFEEIPPQPPSNVPKKTMIRNLSGVRGQGPNYLTTGGMDHFDFTGLKPGTKYCVWIMGRTEGGTQGCTSLIWSNQPCTTTQGEQKPAKILGKVAQISVRWQSWNLFHMTGSGFLANRNVIIRVSGPGAAGESYDRDANGRPIKTDAHGAFDVTLSGLCAQRGRINFSADNGGRPAKTVSAECQGRVESVPKPKIRP
jgi:hypothetical protein